MITSEHHNIEMPQHLVTLCFKATGQKIKVSAKYFYSLGSTLVEAVICADILEQEIPVCVIWMEPVGGVSVLLIKAMWLNEGTSSTKTH